MTASRTHACISNGRSHLRFTVDVKCLRSLTRAILLCLLFLPMVCSAQVLAFIGSPISVERTGISCEELAGPQPEGNALKEVCIDSVFLFRYKVVEAVLGSFENHEIEFLGTYHYSGLPDYVLFDPALLMLKPVRGRLVLQHIENVERQENVWWVCEERNGEEACVKRLSAKESISLIELKTDKK